MSKRAAQVQITADNVDYEDDGDDGEEGGRGQYTVASSDRLQQRLIKTARRYTSAESGVEKASTGIFSGINLIGSQAPPPPLQKFVTTEPASNRNDDAHYLEQLGALNTSFCAWITKHVTDNAFVDLTPVFKDYEKHLATIEKTSVKGGESARVAKAASKEETKPLETLVGLDRKLDTKAEVKVDRKEEQKVETVEKKGGDEEGDGGDDDSEEPQEEKPKHKSTIDDEIEKNALMKTRAKLFYKKGEEYIELGTGNLLVSKTTGSGVQLLMRNETTLGKVLLNVRVTAQMPLTVKGNNVFLVCLPNPPLTSKPPDNPTPATYLIRVKTGDIATNLHSTIKQSA